MEVIRREANNEKPIPKGLEFPKSSMNENQLLWLSILEGQEIKDLNNYTIDWLIDPNWEKYLVSAIEKNKSALLLNLLGVMKYENFRKGKSCGIMEK